MAKKIKKDRIKAYVTAVGTIYEVALEHKKNEKMKTKDDEEIACQVLTGSLSLKTDDGIHDFSVFLRDKKTDGEENSQFKSMLTALKFNPVIQTRTKDDKNYIVLTPDEDKEHTVAKISGSFEVNDYYHMQSGELRTGYRLKASTVSTSRVDSGTGVTAEITAHLYSVEEEIVDKEETGRNIVTFYSKDYKNNYFPFQTILEGEDVDSLDEDDIGMVADFTINIEKVSRGDKGEGGKKEKATRFKRKAKVETSSGYAITELYVVDVNNEREEPDEDDKDAVYISESDVKKGIKERKKMLEQLVEETKKKQEKGEDSGKKDFKSKKKKSVEVDDEDDDF